MKAELQKEFEKQTPSIEGCSSIEYLQTFISWLNVQMKKLKNEI